LTDATRNRGSGQIAFTATTTGRSGKQEAEKPKEGDRHNLSVVRKAVVLGHGDIALGVVRALAQSGVKVIYVSTATRDHAWFSKFISDRVRAPSLKDNGRELLGLFQSLLFLETGMPLKLATFLLFRDGMSSQGL